QGQRELFFKPGHRGLDPRVHSQCERLRVSLSGNDEVELVLARQDERSTWRARCIAIDRCNWTSTIDRLWSSITKIPDEAVHSRFSRQTLRRAHPISRDRQFFL